MLRALCVLALASAPVAAVADQPPRGSVTESTEVDADEIGRVLSDAFDNQLAALGAVDVREEKPKPRRVDLSRFSNGPRNVARPRGRALARAAALGIGTHEATIKLLRSGASAELRAAVDLPRPRTLLWPVPGGHPGRGFGFTRRVRTDLRHNGIDIGAEAGTAVRAAEAGLVVYSDNTLAGYGNAVIILHGGGLMTLYAHNQRTTVQAGWFVERGERVALLGATGYAWGPHLHFELRDGFRPRDPAPMIRGFHSDEIAGPLAELDARLDVQRMTAKAPSAPASPTSAARPAPKPDAIEQTPAAAPAAKALEPVPATDSARAQRDAFRLAMRALRGETPQTTGEVGGTFRTLLFPLKGGRIARGYERTHRALRLEATQGAGVRAVADGLVLYSGATGNVEAAETSTIVLLHADGTCSSYEASLVDAVATGMRVLRGQWLGKLAQKDGLSFAWHKTGAAIDPSAVLVGQPLAP